jgi:hypothetical protein
MNFKRTVFFISLLSGFAFILQMQSCRLDDFDTSPDVKLVFSTDSLLFDTVFTTVGSATRYFKVYNPGNSRVNISHLDLAGGNNSYFRMNADGRAGRNLTDIEIGPRDSIFVFVEVTVDPVDQDLPLIITDSIVFSINNNVQNVKLVAWGQDAHFLSYNYTFPDTDVRVHLLLEDTHWSGPKPYVVYGIVLVAPNVTLTIDKGTRVHMHHRSSLVCYPESTLKVRGTLEEPVVIQGDRLEKEYSDRPGQWGLIYLMVTSRDHEIDYAVIKNGTYGVVMDSIGSLTEPSLRIRNSIIKNMDQIGLELNGAWAEVSNTLVANCGVNAIVMQYGGNYDFRHVTVANYYSMPGPIRQSHSVVINNFYLDENRIPQVRPIEKAYFGNSIIYGSLQEEILINFYPDNSSANFLFDNCLVRTTTHNELSFGFANSIFNQNPRFFGVTSWDYRLQEESPAIGVGSSVIASELPFDILGNSRAERVDLGAYQYYEIVEEE